MESFVHTGLPMRVVFGSGTLARLPEEAAALGVSRALVLSTPGHAAQAEAVRRDLGAAGAAVFAEAAMHTPVEVTARAMAMVAREAIDGTVAVGGGSTIGLGKAIALRTGLPQIAVPTTYAGSEMTPVVGQTEHGRKTTLRDMAVLPETTIYDVDLTLSLPPALSAVSGLNAIAHAVEALYARDRNPIVSLMAVEAVRALAGALPRIAADPGDRDARAGALRGAWLCGVALGSVGMALHHKLCHTLGGSFGLPHAETHAVILPHAAAFNAAAVPELLAPVAEILGAEGVGAGLQALARRLGAPTALADLGLPEAALDDAAAIAAETPYWNPRPVDRAAIRDLLGRAWRGDPAAG